MPTHPSILAWRIPWTEEPSGLQSMGLQRARHNYSDLAYPLSWWKDFDENNPPPPPGGGCSLASRHRV